METKEMNEAVTAQLIGSLLSKNEEEMNVLCEVLNDFESEAGYTLPSFEFGKVVLTESNSYLELAESEEFAVVESDSTSDVESEVNEGGDPSPSTSASGDEALEDEESFEKESAPEMTSEKRNENTSEDVNLIPLSGNEEEDEYEQYSEIELDDSEDENETLSASNGSLKAEMEKKAGIASRLSDVITDGSNVPCLNLRDHMKVIDCIEVCVPEVRNPHRFILQLRKFKAELTDLMARMLMFYNLNFEKYALGNNRLRKDDVCAVLHRTNPECREWYRAKMIKYDLYFSKVLLIDYGVTIDVRNTNITYLRRDFGYLPVQAINGHLANIKPYKGKYWSVDSCELFCNLVFEEDLVAQVVRMMCKKQWLNVILEYEGEEDISINEILIKKPFPVRDCDFNEDDLFTSVTYESIDKMEFIDPEKLGLFRRPKSEFRESRKRAKVPEVDLNGELRKLFGLEASDDEESLS